MNFIKKTYYNWIYTNRPKGHGFDSRQICHFLTFVATCLFSMNLNISIKFCIEQSIFYAQPQNFFWGHQWTNRVEPIFKLELKKNLLEPLLKWSTSNFIKSAHEIYRRSLLMTPWGSSINHVVKFLGIFDPLPLRGHFY